LKTCKNDRCSPEQTKKTVVITIGPVLQSELFSSPNHCIMLLLIYEFRFWRRHWAAALATYKHSRSLVLSPERRHRSHRLALDSPDRRCGRRVHTISAACRRSSDWSAVVTAKLRLATHFGRFVDITTTIIIIIIMLRNCLFLLLLLSSSSRVETEYFEV